MTIIIVLFYKNYYTYYITCYPTNYTVLAPVG